jgi:hypothetical protein
MIRPSGGTMEAELKLSGVRYSTQQTGAGGSDGKSSGRGQDLYMEFLESGVGRSRFDERKDMGRDERLGVTVSDLRRSMGSNGRRVHLVYYDFLCEVFEWNV